MIIKLKNSDKPCLILEKVSKNLFECVLENKTVFVSSDGESYRYLSSQFELELMNPIIELKNKANKFRR